MRVTNINGTTDNTCRCGSWLDHWKRFSGQQAPALCPEVRCLRATEVGAHVQLASGLDRSWYIVPLCSEHNAQTRQSLDISDAIKLVSANVAATCGPSQRRY